MIGRELKRILQKTAAFVCVIVYFGLMILGVESDLKMGYESGLLNLFWFTENFGVTAFIQRQQAIILMNEKDIMTG